MCFDALPVEVLELILDNLSLADLLNASLVCRHWGLAAEELILRKSKITINTALARKLDLLSTLTRNFGVFYLNELDLWEDMQPVLEVCVQMFRPRSINIGGILADHLNRFYQVYHAWMESVKRVSISLDDRFVEYLTFNPEHYTLDFPSAKFLNWYECLYGAGEKTVTINAPNLKEIIVDDSLDDTSLLKIPGCTKVVKLRCTFYTKTFAEIFDSTFPNLAILELFIYNDVKDFEFLEKLEKTNLRKLYLVVQYYPDNISWLSSNSSRAIYECKRLKHLQYIVLNDTTCCTISLSQIAESLNELQYLELSNVFIEAENDVLHLPSTKTIILERLSFVNDRTGISINVPALEVLSTPVLHLQKFYCTTESSLKQVDVELDSMSLREAFEDHLVPFLQRFSNVTQLLVTKSNIDEGTADNCFSSSTRLSVSTIRFKCLNINLSCLEHISTWNDLKELSLESCCIIVEDFNGTVALDNLQRLKVAHVSLSDPTRADFPLTCCTGSEIERYESRDSEIYFSNC